jgi:hypothetical protein
MSKSKGYLNQIRLGMVLTMFLCLFMCPYSFGSLIDHFRSCGPEITCQDLCNCHNQDQHNCALESGHIHEFSNETTQANELDFSYIDWSFIVLIQLHPPLVLRHSKEMLLVSNSSFTVRHLQTIRLLI